MVSDLNLLPPPRRRELARQAAIEDRNRFLSSITMGLILITLVGFVSIGVLQSLISASFNQASTQLAEIITQYTALRESVGAQNSVLSTMGKTLTDRLLWSDKMYELLAVIPKGITIQSMKGASAEKATITFAGQAATRNALIILEQKLKTIPWATSVDAPNSNLIDRTNAPFEFILLLK